MRNIWIKTFVGALAGVLMWLLFEPFHPGLKHLNQWDRWETEAMAGLGAAVGCFVSLTDSLLQGKRSASFLGAGLGLILGLIGGVVGHAFAGQIFVLLGGSDTGFNIIPRTFAFIPLGAVLGLAVGASTLSGARMLRAGIGGAIGGAIAGMLFDPIGLMIAPIILLTARGGVPTEIGGPSRAVMFVLLGAFVAFFVGIVELVSRSAWLRLSLGRNEGKEWAIYSSQTLIGRSERSNVPLFGDSNVQATHCVITRHGNDYVLHDGGSMIGTYVNGQRVSQFGLQAGDMIQIGSFALQFLMKDATARARAPEAYQGLAYPIQGAPGTQPMQGYGQQPQAYGQPTQQMQPGSGVRMPVQAPTGAMPSVSMPTQTYAAPIQTSQPTSAYAPTQSGFSLVAMDGPLQGKRFPITSPTEVGRDCPAIPISYDLNASRRHSRLSPSVGGLEVADLGSRNGTFLNGAPVQTTQAKPGDVLKIGATSFRVEAGA